MALSNETKVGALTIIGLAVLFIGSSFLKGNNVFKSENTFYAYYEDTQGLDATAPITLNGIRIGRVATLDFIQDGTNRIKATFAIDGKYNIPLNTEAKIFSPSPIADKIITLTLGDGDGFHESGDELIGVMSPGLLDAFEPLQDKITSAISSLDSTLSGINSLLSVENKARISSSLVSLDESLNNLASTSRELDKTMSASSGKITNILEDFESLSKSLSQNTAKINAIVSNAESFSDELAKVKIQETMANANAAIENLTTLLNGVSSGEGSLGLLMKDEELYNNISSATKNLDALLIDLENNPGKYIRIRLGDQKEKKQ